MTEEKNTQVGSNRESNATTTEGGDITAAIKDLAIAVRHLDANQTARAESLKDSIDQIGFELFCLARPEEAEKVLSASGYTGGSDATH